MNAVVFLSFFLPCVSAFNPAPPAIKANTGSAFRLPVTQATDVLDAPVMLTDAVVPPLPGQPQILTDAMATNNVMKMKEEKVLLDKPKPMPAQVQAMRPAQAQAAAAAAAAEPEQNTSIFQQPVFMGASIAGLFASMFGAAGLVLHRRKANKTAERLAVNAAAAALALATATSGATPAFAAGNAANGETVFSGNCAACHAGGNNVIQAEKTLKKAALTEYLAGGFKEESIVYQVTNGKNAMPAFGGRLSDEEIGDVAAYVYKTSNADSWE